MQYTYTHNKLTQNITSRRVCAKITGKLLILCNFDLHHSIRTTLLYKILFAEFKKLFWFWFYGIKCKPTFEFLNAHLSMFTKQIPLHVYMFACNVRPCPAIQSYCLQTLNRKIKFCRIWKIKPCWAFCAIEWEKINIFRFRKKYFVEKRCTNWIMYVEITQD